MNPEELIRRCHRLAGHSPEAIADADSLISFFQVFRPDGNGLAGLFADLECGNELHQRLDELFIAAGDDRRPTGGRDVYFVVRQPKPIDPDEVKEAGADWLRGVREIAVAMKDDEVAEMLAPLPKFRVLEGIPPKHPKAEAEKSHLLRTISTSAPAMVQRIEVGDLAPALRQAYYFTACDKMLGDYLMWPFYQSVTGLNDPLKPYFKLWKHGVKYRIFNESQVDLYLPRQPD